MAALRRFETGSATLTSDFESLILETRKALGLIRGVAVDLEREEKSDMVKQLDDTVLELLATTGECAHFAAAIRTVSDGYQPQEHQLTDFKRLLEAEFNKVKRDNVLLPQSDPLYRKFKEDIWNVHHAGLPMPGDDEEIMMTSTQCSLLNAKCPLTGKSVFDLESPVRCKDCKHIYEKDAVIHYIRTKKPHPQCPVAGCPKILQAARIYCDPMLRVEIEDARSRESEAMDAQMVEDFDED